MPFRMTARTLLHLGAELISSDGVAFYELIKNAFDAGSQHVEITVVMRMPHDIITELRNQLHHFQVQHPGSEQVDVTIREILCQQILSSIDSTAPHVMELRSQVLEAHTWQDFTEVIEEANFIVIADSGEGMSFNDLSDVYLTIGTPMRLKQRQARQTSHSKVQGSEPPQPILGEKGVGRLAVMRLGRRLHVQTSKMGEKCWNVLNIDWSAFSHDSDAFVEDISVAPIYGDMKEDIQISGTIIRVSSLESNWTRGKLSEIAKDEFSKLTDPFQKKPYPIELQFNHQIITIPRFDKIIFEHAHATVEATFDFDEQNKPRLSGKIDYRLRQRVTTFVRESAHLYSICGTSPSTLPRLGPFTMTLHWYNRQILAAIDGIGNQKQVRDLVAAWAGGLMVYRDGFRVNPYGNLDDDWLDLDRRALASGGFKVNRRQIIGKVDISSIHNPYLVDQTNREGLRENEEKRALVNILKHILEGAFRPFLNKVEQEVQAREPIRFDELAERVEKQRVQVQQSFKLLLQRYPQIREDTQIISIIDNATKKIKELMDQAAQLAQSYETGRTQILNLAGQGMMVEILAHELNRATAHTLATLADADTRGLSVDARSLLSTLESQLHTLQKRLRILDPLSTSGRQHKEVFDVIAWIREIVKSHEAQFRRHHVDCRIDIQPKGSEGTLRVRLVKGMVVQILENLISNSVYWLKEERKLDLTFRPEIRIIIDTNLKQIRFTDNGPGIDPIHREDIFQPFVTTKPPGQGKGLGLFISREIAHYNDAMLYLLNEPTVHPNSLNTFIFDLEAKKS